MKICAEHYSATDIKSAKKILFSFMDDSVRPVRRWVDRRELEANFIDMLELLNSDALDQCFSNFFSSRIQFFIFDLLEVAADPVSWKSQF